MRILALVFCVLGMLASPVLGQQEPTLPQVLDEFERIEKELQVPDLPEKRKEQLQQRQQILLDQLEKLAPLPPTVRPDRPRPAEEQLEQDQLRHDAIQEKDVEKRLP